MEFRLGSLCQCYSRASTFHRHVAEDVVALSQAQNREENAGSYHLPFLVPVPSSKVLSASWQLLTAFSSHWLHCEIVSAFLDTIHDSLQISGPMGRNGLVSQKLIGLNRVNT